MATSSNSRVKNLAIITIVFGFLVSSIAGTFLLAFQGSGNSKSPAEIEQERLINQLQEQQKEQEAIVHEPLEGHTAKPFDKDSVKELKVETIKEGSGKAATADSTVVANYFGWTSDGKIFDSNKGIDFPLSGVIEGWTKGLTGVKEGATVKLLIPGEMAYGNEDDGSGRPYGPLAFIVELEEVK